ncbi:MAG: extracellular solute-binding protein [Bacteroidales bacterium]|nr:extracellular solute-binding protein [Clostridium sp.]MCM1203238.1 extracellular solute-binding protein [Bacteroidales bacterium]
MRSGAVQGLWFMLMVLVITMAGCNKQEDWTEEKREDGSAVYEENVLAMEEIAGDIRKYLIKEDRIYLFTEEWTGNENESGEEASSEAREIEQEVIYRAYSANLDGGEVKEIPLPDRKENETMFPLLIGEDEGITFFVNTGTENGGEAGEFLLKTDQQGKELFREDITEAMQISEKQDISRMLMDGKGRLVYVTDGIIGVLDEEGRFSFELKTDDRLSGIARMKNGQIACAFDGREEAKVRIIDMDKKKWGAVYKPGLQSFGNSDALLEGAEYDFYYRDNSGIYGYDTAQESSTKLVDYIESGIDMESAYSILSVGKGCLLGMRQTDGDLILYRKRKEDAAGLEEKKVITVGITDEAATIEEEIKEFNQNSQKYKLKVKEYSQGFDAITKLNTEIIAGNAPDVIIGLQNLPVEQYVAKGVLEDLTPYYEKDSTVSPEELSDSVAEAMKINDRFYYLAAEFGINTLIGSTDIVGEAGGWNMDELKALLREKPGKRLFYMENKSHMLYAILDGGMNDFIDWNTGECFFDSREFKDILEICNTGQDEETEYSNAEMVSLMREGKILLAEEQVGYNQIQIYEELFGGEITFIGYPCEDRQGSYFAFYQQMGIYSRSEVKEGAWEFIRMFMTKKYQEDVLGIPTREDCLDNAIQRYNRNAVETPGFFDYESVVIEMEPMSEKRQNKLKELISHTHKSYSGNTDLMGIIQEEAEAYFAGDKSIEETVMIIQQRAATYVNENR